MTEAEAVASRVLERVLQHGPIRLDELERLLPCCTWNQMFPVVDRLCREGKLVLRRPDRFTYMVVLPPSQDGQADSSLRRSRSEAARVRPA